MKLIGIITTRNESDILRECFAHHSVSGIHGMIVVDHGSTDDTPEVIREWESSGFVLQSTRFPASVGFRQSEWMTAASRRAAELGATWIVPIDSDEHWVGLSALRRARRDVACVHTGPWRHHLRSHETSAAFADNPYYEIPGRTGDRIARWDTRHVGKIVHRPGDFVVPIGSHRVESICKFRSTRIESIEVHHFPVRSAGQLVAKAASGSHMLDVAGHPQEIASHWREWNEMIDQYGADHVMSRFSISEVEIRERMSDGSLWRWNR